MNDEPVSLAPREGLRRELEAARRAYHELLFAIPDADWDRPSANPAWTVRQMMFHITLALRFLPADVAVLRRGRIPPIPSWLFNGANEWYTRLVGSRQTRASLAAEYDKRHNSVITLLDTVEPHEWTLAGQYPDINRNLQGTRTLADMFHYLSMHFEEHAADVRQVLATTDSSGGQPRTPEQAARPPRGITRLLFRAPLVLFRLGLGWLLGGRFMLLTHIGRKSGLPRQAVLEVAEHDAATDTYYVASGFGRESQWFKNVQTNPHVTIQVGPRVLEATAEVLDPDASGEKMVEYARHYPRAAQALSRVLGYQIDGSENRYRRLGHDYISFVAMRPRRVLRESPGARELAAPLLILLLLLLLFRHLRGSRSLRPSA